MFVCLSQCLIGRRSKEEDRAGGVKGGGGGGGGKSNGMGLIAGSGG